MRYILIISLMLLSPLFAQDLTDSQIKQEIIKQSINNYRGNCPCPYNHAKNGSKCGKRSAWSRAGGYAPYCYESDVSDAQVKQYRARMKKAA